MWNHVKCTKTTGRVSHNWNTVMLCLLHALGMISSEQQRSFPKCPTVWTVSICKQVLQISWQNELFVNCPSTSHGSIFWRPNQQEDIICPCLLKTITNNCRKTNQFYDVSVWLDLVWHEHNFCLGWNNYFVKFRGVWITVTTITWWSLWSWLKKNVDCWHEMRNKQPSPMDKS